MRVAKEFTFDDEDVTSWCQQADDHNGIHLNDAAVEGNPFFDERIVPGMMLLDKVSGLITQWSEAQDGDNTPVISRMSNIVFEEPVYLDEEITILVEEEGAEENMHILRFAVTDSVTVEPRMEGFVTIYLV